MEPGPNGGMLWRGHPRPTPGPGRPPSAIRDAMRAALEERLPILAVIADDEDARATDRIAALGLLARYGLPQGIEVSGPDGEPLAVETVLAAAEERLRYALQCEGPERLLLRLAARADGEGRCPCSAIAEGPT